MRARHAVWELAVCVPLVSVCACDQPPAPVRREQPAPRLQPAAPQARGALADRSTTLAPASESPTERAPRGAPPGPEAPRALEDSTGGGAGELGAAGDSGEAPPNGSGPHEVSL